eukprot:SAG31_NODE_4162_length_3521_cov_31.856224_3_plen_52_part_00
MNDRVLDRLEQLQRSAERQQQRDEINSVGVPLAVQLAILCPCNVVITSELS